MSYRKEKQKSLLGLDTNKLGKTELQQMSQSALKSRMHGLCFSPYEEEQNQEILSLRFKLEEN